jgi:hypothetical protein
MNEQQLKDEVGRLDQRCFDLEQQLADERTTNYKLLQALSRSTGLTEPATRLRFLGTIKK